jgi:uncharacterized protein (DUF4415 family)
MHTRFSNSSVGPLRADQLKPSSPEHMAELRRRIAEDDIDTSDIPESTPEQIKKAAAEQRRRWAAAGKERVTMFLDRDIVDAFRQQGPGYQTRINDVLREYLTSGRMDKTPAELLEEARRALDRTATALGQMNNVPRKRRMKAGKKFRRAAAKRH